MSAMILTCAPPNDPTLELECESCGWDTPGVPATIVIASDEWMNTVCDECHAGYHHAQSFGGASDCPILKAQAAS